MSRIKLKTGLTAIVSVLLLAVIAWSIWTNFQATNEISTSSTSSFKNTPPSGIADTTSAKTATRSIDSDSVLAAMSAPAIIIDKLADKALIKDHVTYGRDLAVAFILYANDHHGALPSDISAVRDKLENTEKNYPFKILYHGPLDKVKKPAQTVMLGEEPFMLSDGRLARNYVFADGHVELATSATSDFSSWESDHAPSLLNP